MVPWAFDTIKPRSTVHSLLKFNRGHYRFLTWGEDHFDKTPKLCCRKILVAACDVK
jgi:hypothetical protein